METAVFEGFILNASMILGLGAQNIFVMECGLRKDHHLLVAAICSLCDALLILLGVLGAGTLFINIPILKIVFGSFGVMALGFYGLQKLREHPVPAHSTTRKGSFNTSRSAVLRAMAFSLLNPHVYLDTVVMIGGFSTEFAEVKNRLLFGLGAIGSSIVWFLGLALLSSRMSLYLKDPKKMKVVWVISGILLIFLALKLGRDVWTWASVYSL